MLVFGGASGLVVLSTQTMNYPKVKTLKIAITFTVNCLIPPKKICQFHEPWI